MRLEKEFLKRGVAVRFHEGAHDGETRYGFIRKELKIFSPSDWGDGKCSIVGLWVDMQDDTIGIEFLDGTMPLAQSLFYALLADRDVRRMILEYQSRSIYCQDGDGERVVPFKIWSSEGRTGRQDIFITRGYEKGGFLVTRTQKLCHISQFGRLNEGFDPIYIGDFVEICAYLGLTDDMNVKRLRKKANVKYIRPKFAEELEVGYKTEVTKIL